MILLTFFSFLELGLHQRIPHLTARTFKISSTVPCIWDFSCEAVECICLTGTHSPLTAPPASGRVSAHELQHACTTNNSNQFHSRTIANVSDKNKNENDQTLDTIDCHTVASSVPREQKGSRRQFCCNCEANEAEKWSVLCWKSKDQNCKNEFPKMKKGSWKIHPRVTFFAF